MELPPPPPQWPREKIPKDGPGPRGVPDIYYTSRVLNSTGRYAKFVRKLRATEEEERKGNANKHKELLDKQTNDFFIRCDRRSLVNNVARRVDLCMRSYDEDLEKKKQRLKALFNREEEQNIRLFVEQAQAGAQSIWEDKMERLEYLLAKRKKEHEDKYKDTPLSKAAHVLPCIYKLRAKEAQEIQLYQMREKQSIKQAEREFDKMWHAIAMKESEALSARLEQEAIMRYRACLECKEHSDQQLELKKIRLEKDRQMLKREQLALKAKFDEDERKEQEAERVRQEKQKVVVAETAQIAALQKVLQAKQDEEDGIIREAWKSLAGQGLAEEQAKIELMRRKEKDLDVCNRKMIELRNQLEEINNDDTLMNEVLKQQQDAIDQRRCKYKLWSEKNTRDVKKAVVDQIQENKEKREKIQRDIDQQNEYFRQLRRQQDALVANNEREEAELQKLYQRGLVEQKKYLELQKAREKAEEEDQQRKGHQASKEYDEEMQRMLCRPFFSEEVHPFMKQMAKGLKMRVKCKCAKDDYCK